MLALALALSPSPSPDPKQALGAARKELEQPGPPSRTSAESEP